MKKRDPHRFVGLPDDVNEETQTNGIIDQVDELRVAISRLPERERTAVHLFYLDEHGAEHVRTLLKMRRCRMC